MKNVIKGNYTFYNVLNDKEIIFKKYKSNIILEDTYKIVNDGKSTTQVFKFKGFGNTEKDIVLFSGTITSKKPVEGGKQVNTLDMYVFNINNGKQEYVQMEMKNGVYKAVKGTKTTPSKIDSMETEHSKEACHVAVERLMAYETMLSPKQKELYGELTKNDSTPTKN